MLTGFPSSCPPWFHKLWCDTVVFLLGSRGVAGFWVHWVFGRLVPRLLGSGGESGVRVHWVFGRFRPRLRGVGQGLRNCCSEDRSKRSV